MMEVCIVVSVLEVFYDNDDYDYDDDDDDDDMH